MSDQMFDFDTSKERQQVEAFDRSLDKLMDNINKLDRMSVDRFTKQFDEMAKGQTAAARQVTDVARKLVSDMEQLAKLSSQKMKSMADLGPISALMQGIKKDAPLLKQVLETALVEMREQMYRNSSAMVAQAQLTAKNIGAAYSEIGTQLSRNMPSGMSYKQFFANFSKEFEGLKGVAAKSAKESASVFADNFALEAARGKQIFADFNKFLGLNNAVVAKSAKDSASVFTEAFALEASRGKQIFANFNRTLGLDNTVVAKSAKDSATVFTEAFALEAARGKQVFANFNRALGIDNDVVVKSAKDSASVFTEAFALEASRGKQIFANFNRALGIDNAVVAKSAKDSASVFTEAFALEAARGKQIFANFNRVMGLDNTAVAKSAKDSANVFSQAFAVEAANNAKSLRAFERLVGIDDGSVRKSAKQSADVFAEAYAVEMAKNKQFFSAFENRIGIGSAGTGINARNSMFNIPKEEIDNAEKLSGAFKRLASDGNDVHSMARGLASGFGALWLTWGNLVPLFIGAGISNGFVQTAKTGMEVAHTMEIIANLGGNTATEMQSLQDKLDAMGKSGPFGPLAIAESMKVLSLAGLKANDILTATQDVLNFSVAGTTDLKTAADTLISISTAFDMGAGGFGRVADVVSKAAAESKTSVESFSNAMKTASVIHKQYGVSLEDTATSLAAMSQLGIEASAAGTALRNMYSDLSGRSVQVAKILKAQGIEMRTATGEFKPLIQVVSELNDKFRKLDGISQKNLMQALLSERGAKGIIEMLSLIGTTAVGMQGNVTNALVVLNEKITESYGFAAINAAKMAQTAKSQFDAVKATLATSLNEAYRAMEPELLLIFDGLKKAFGSPEFIEGVKTLVDVISRLGLAFVENAGIIATYAGVMASLKLAQMGLVAASTALIAAEGLVARAHGTSAAAAEANAVATNASTAANLRNAGSAVGVAGAMGTFARMLPGIGTAITVAAGAWMAYEFWQTKSKNASKDAADLYNNNVVKTLQDQANRLKELNDLRATGISLAQAQALVDSRNKVAAAVDPYADNVNKAIKAESDAREELNKRQAAYDKVPVRDNLRRVEEQQKRLTLASRATAAAKVEETTAMNAANEAAARVAAESRRQADLDAAEAKRRKDELTSSFGNAKFELGTDKKTRPGANGEFNLINSNEIAQLEKLMNARLDTLKNGYDNEKKLLDARYNAGLVKEGDYQAQLLTNTLSYESNYISTIEGMNKDYIAVYEKRYAEIASLRDAAEKAGATKKVSDLDEAIKNLNNAKDTYIKTNTEKVSKMEADAYVRNAEASIKAEGALIKLTKANKEHWENQEAQFQANQQANALADYYENSSKSILSFTAIEKAAVTAAAAERARQSSYLMERNRDLEEAQARYTAFINAEVEDSVKLTQAYQDEAARLGDMVAKTQSIMDESRVNADSLVTRIANAAAERQQKELIRNFSYGIADSFATAIFEGGKTGGKQLRDFLKKELLREPFTIMLRGFMNGIMGGITSAIGGMMGGAGSGGMGILSGLSMLSSANTALGVLNTGYAGAMGSGIGSVFGTTAGNAALAESLGLGAASANAAATGAAVAGGANPATAGFMSQLGSGLSAAAPVAAVIGLALNALGAFKSERKVGGGLSGTLGGGTLSAWEEWREGGTLFSGPSYSRFDPTAELEKARKRLADLEAMPEGEGRSLERIAQQRMIVDNLEEKYGDVAKATSAQSKIIQDAYDKMRVSAGKMAETLGLSGEKARAFTTALGGEKGLNFEGLDAEKQQALITQALDTASNEIAQQVIGTWETVTKDVSRIISENMGSAGEDANYVFTELTNTVTETRYVASQYAKEGEKAIDTLTRLASSLTSVNTSFDMLGFTMLEASMKGADLASMIVDAFGSLDTFNSSTAYLFDNFYSDAERQEARVRALDKQFKELGVSVPASKDAFIDLIEAQDLSTAEGRKMFAALTQMAPIFKEVADGATSVVDSAKDIAKSNLEKAAEALRKAYRKAMEGLEEQISTVEDTISSLSGIIQLLKDNIRELYDEATSTSGLSAAQGQQYITTALAALRANGTVPDEKKLGDAISSVRKGIDNRNFTSQFEEDNARLVLAGELGQMLGVLEPQLTTAERSLEVLNDQYKLMERELALYEEQLDALDDNYVATLDVAAAVREFQSAFLEYMNTLTNGTGGTGGGTGTGVKPGGTGGGGYSYGPGPSGGGTRVDYGAEEALTSFDKFKAWYNGLRYSADPKIFQSGEYQVPDWLRLSNGLADDGTDKEMFGQYLFFKNNQGIAQDYEKIMTTGRSGMNTDGSTLIRSDLSKMPTEIAEYYKNNQNALMTAEGFGMDPVLMYRMYKEGGGQFGISQKDTNFTEWLQTHKWTENGIIQNNNVLEMANKDWKGYNLARWDTSNGTIINIDGKIYTPEGKLIGTASRSQMEGLYGKDFVNSMGYSYGDKTRSQLYQNLVGSNFTEQDYYSTIKTNLDSAIARGDSAQSLVDAVRSTGASMADVANAYGISMEQLVQNLRNGGATDIPMFAGGGFHSGGVRIVGERGWELEATGASRIWNQEQLAQALVGKEDGSSYDIQVIVELRAIRSTNEQMLAELIKLRQLNQTWDNEGLPATRNETA